MEWLERVLCELVKHGEAVNGERYAFNFNCLKDKTQEQKSYTLHECKPVILQHGNMFRGLSNNKLSKMANFTTSGLLTIHYITQLSYFPHLTKHFNKEDLRLKMWGQNDLQIYSYEKKKIFIVKETQLQHQENIVEANDDYANQVYYLCIFM